MSKEEKEKATIALACKLWRQADAKADFGKLEEALKKYSVK